MSTTGPARRTTELRKHIAAVTTTLLMVGSAGTLAAAPANAAEPTAGKTLFAWGANSDGQLGGGAARSTPDEVALELPPGVEVKAAVAGEKHNLAVTTDGALYGWGSNGSGQLGDGTLTRRPTPVRITLPDEAGVQAVAAGDNHSLAAATDGTLYAWGFNGSGQLGTGKVSNDRTPVKVALPDDVRVEAVAAGDNHSVALATNGSVYAWSYNGSGQLGDGTMSNAPTPVKVALPDDVRIEVVAAAGEHSVAVATDGLVYAWGNNVYGQLGDGTMNNASTPIKVAPLEGVKIEVVAAAGSHSLAVGSDGSAYAWGTNMYGQLGNGQNTGGRTPVEVALPDDVDAVAVAAADYHSLAVASDGSAYAWGYNASGQLGDGTKQDSLAPVEVKLPEGVEAGGVAAGLNHSLAIGEVAPEVQLQILDVTAEGSTVTVTGTGKPGTTITITLGDQTREATVGQDGTWTAVFNDVTPGNHSVTVTDENGNVLAESQDPVTVPEPEDPTPPTPPTPPAPPGTPAGGHRRRRPHRRPRGTARHQPPGQGHRPGRPQRRAGGQGHRALHHPHREQAAHPLLQDQPGQGRHRQGRTARRPGTDPVQGPHHPEDPRLQDLEGLLQPAQEGHRPRRPHRQAGTQAPPRPLGRRHRRMVQEASHNRPHPAPTQRQGLPRPVPPQPTEGITTPHHNNERPRPPSGPFGMVSETPARRRPACHVSWAARASWSRSADSPSRSSSRRPRRTWRRGRPSPPRRSW